MNNNNCTNEISTQEENKTNERNYPNYVLRILRKSINAKEDDTRFDKEFNTEWSPNEVFESVLQWEGIGRPKAIKEWVKDIYGVDLDEIK